MYFCYVDESGTPEVPGTTSHFVLAGIAIPVARWREADAQLTAILSKFDLSNAELHVAWMLRIYQHQKTIPGFDSLDFAARRAAMARARASELLKLQKGNNRKLYKQTAKTFKHTEPYVHLTLAERQQLINEVATAVSGWDFAHLFAECIDKVYFDPAKTKRTISEQAFEQIVSRFEKFLKFASNTGKQHGVLVHDNNQTVAHRHTEMMRAFHDAGTLWTKVDSIIETPLFVDSRLTRMVQVADLCSYALRRYLENNEEPLFKLIFSRADKITRGVVVGVRHWADMGCKCLICSGHRQPKPPGWFKRHRIKLKLAANRKARVV